MTIDNSLINFYSTSNVGTDIKVISKDDKMLKEQTDGFESMLIKQLLDDALKDENSLFEKGAGSDIYQSMYNDAISKASSGGFGFSAMLFNFLKENSTNSSYNTTRN